MPDIYPMPGASWRRSRCCTNFRNAQAYLNEFAFRHNRRFWKFSAFKRLLQLALTTQAPSYRVDGGMGGGSKVKSRTRPRPQVSDCK